MELQGQALIQAPRDEVWRALNDPDVLRQCIPGCEEIELSGQNEMTAKVVAKVGPIRARFGGRVMLSDFDPPKSYTITGEGNGGAAGMVRGSARVRLAEQDGQTLLSYDTDAQIAGKLAQIGARLIDMFVKKTAAEFFDRLGELMAQRTALSASSHVHTIDEETC